MKTYIVLLRGINVSGKNKILMQDLRVLLESMKFTNIKTYIQSGNVIITTSKSKKEIAKAIENGIEKTFYFKVPVVVLLATELKKIVNNNPFYNKNKETKQLYITFFKTIPQATEKLDAFDFGKDKYKIIENYMYVKYNKSAGSTKLTNKIVENKLAVIATSRNWRTSNKLIELSEN